MVCHEGWYARLTRDGAIKNHKYGYPGTRGELRAPLYKEQKQTMWQVARLVAAHFLPGWDESLQVEHVDGDRTNNHVINLRMTEREAH